MKHTALSLAALLLAAALLLCACGQPADPTLQTTLAETGLDLQFSGCAVTERTTAFQTSETAAPETVPLFAAEGRPELTLSGVQEDQVTVRFASAQGDSYLLYEPNTVMPKLDYRAVQQGDTLTLQLRTVYTYVIAVEQGTNRDVFVVTTQMD